MLESYNKIRIVNKEVFKRIDTFFEEEKKRSLKEIEDGLVKIQEYTTDTNDYFEYETNKIPVLDVKKITKKIFETTNEDSQEEVEYFLEEVLKKFDSLGKKEKNDANRRFLQEKKEAVLEISKKIGEYTEINLLNKIISPNKTDRKKIQEMRKDNRDIPKTYFGKFSEYYNLSEDWVKYGEPIEYIKTILNSEFVEEVYSEEECLVLLKKMMNEGCFQKKEDASNYFIYPSKKKVINLAYEIGLIPQVDIQADMNEYIRQNGDEKFLLFLTYVFLKEDKDYSNDVNYIKELNKILKPTVNLLSDKRGIPNNIDSLALAFFKDGLGKNISELSIESPFDDLEQILSIVLTDDEVKTEMQEKFDLPTDHLDVVFTGLEAMLKNLNQNIVE
ncbi:hypothetical protein [Lactococcus garvieae]|uniref:hypothetical protein n=1 Tax=Lactococcus garvieae TaxID=1363 RepID=UPI0003151365|nr:hypothetical protein [Lactococcus garvieae]